MVDQYQALELFYESPNSRIYKAWDPASGKHVLLKCFPPERQDAYMREMSAAFGIEHPHINRCLDAVYLAEENRSCMVYEFIAGGSLREYLQQHSALPPEEVFNCLQDILKALEYIHGKGFIHCDLKPENILLRKRGGRTRYILGDLGAAASIREAQTGGHTQSSPAYVAPERLYDRFTPSSDLYSLGVIGYELATGQRPFSGDTAQIARAHLSETADFARISHPYLREFIARLMDKEPVQRSSAEQALHHLQQFAAGAPLAVDAPAAQDAALRIAPPPPAAHAIALKRRAADVQMQLEYRLDKLLVFNVEEQVVLGLGYDNNLAVSADPAQRPWYLLANANPVQAQGVHSLAYANRSGVFWLDLQKREQVRLCGTCRDSTAFDVRDVYTLWSTTESVHVYHRGTDAQLSYRRPTYLMRPQLHLLEDGNFAVSEGYMNQTLVLRGADTEKRMVWELDGPIVLCRENAGVLLVMTMNMLDRSRYSLWRLEQGQAVARLDLPETLVQYCHTVGQVFWVTAAGELFACGPELSPVLVGQLPLERIDLLEISLDHRFIAVAHYQGAKTRVQVWENRPVP